GSLNQATVYESLAYSSTGTRSEARAPPIAWELIGSCSISLPEDYLALHGVLADSHEIPSALLGPEYKLVMLWLLERHQICEHYGGSYLDEVDEDMKNWRHGGSQRNV
ncbi:hypothetical protein Golax_005171, partial [Gossypium laxum]|nr:hypothetical protein [Gossypium laxum]